MLPDGVVRGAQEEGGVQRVSLASSEKNDTASLNDTDCRATDTMPQFQLTVFYDAPKGLTPAADAAAAAADATAADATAAAPAAPGPQ